MQYALNTLAGTCFNLEDYKQSAIWLEKLTYLCEKEPPHQLAISLNNLGLVKQHLGQIIEAVGLHERALSILQSQTDLVSLIGVFNNLGRAHLELGNLKQAKLYLGQSLEHGEKLGDIVRHRVITQIHLGNVYVCKTQFSKALSLFQIALSAKLGYSVKSLQCSQAWLLTLLGDTESAEKILEDVIETFPDYLHALFLMVLVKHQQGKLELADYTRVNQYYLQKPNSLIKPLYEWMKSLALPFSEAYDSALEAKHSAEQLRIDPLIQLTNLRLSQLWFEQGDIDESQRYFNAVIINKTSRSLYCYQGEIELLQYLILEKQQPQNALHQLTRTLSWLMDIADNHVPPEYRESFLTNNPVNKAILEAARLEGLVSKTSV